ncbi:hypothetical protein GJ698_02230 [Pseudoduganella sp. FT26W]|uniref:Lipoprotein n=1 Tax=Duganella aquatilis TaxID=2666082 RepID=A0A844CQA9_9BURK|nr:hypothetical protein [Duganella aquatilis]MRW82907.1 hypothetical protein [Duganella aquatilis]
MMFARSQVLAIVGCLFVSGCATKIPKEMVLKDPLNRVIESNVGSNVDKIRLACAKNMLAASPANHATDISTRVVSQGEITTIDVDAVLHISGSFSPPLPVTFNCSYKNGNIYQTHWTRGLK